MASVMYMLSQFGVLSLVQGVIAAMFVILILVVVAKRL